MSNSGSPAVVPVSSMNPERRLALLQVKLRALATTIGAGELAGHRPFAAGAGLLDGPRGWLLVDALEPGSQKPPRLRHGWLGGAVGWAFRRGATELDVMSEHVDGHDARRAALLTIPCRIWKIEGKDLSPVTPTPYVDPPDPPVDVLAFAGIIEAAGAEPVVDHGVLRAEYRGLEVGRVIVHPELGPALEVGVGSHDRLANTLMNGGLDTETALRNAVDAVRRFRSYDRLSHPANQLAKERWLRFVVCAHPDVVGAAALTPVPSTISPQFNESSPAIAVGTDLGGRPIVVACTVGASLDVVPMGADARRARSVPEARLVVVIPRKDDPEVLHDVATYVDPPAEIVVVDRDWPAWV